MRLIGFLARSKYLPGAPRASGLLATLPARAEAPSVVAGALTRKNRPRLGRPPRFGFRRNLQQFSSRPPFFGHSRPALATPFRRGRRGFRPVLRRRNDRFGDPRSPIGARKRVWPPKPAL